MNALGVRLLVAALLSAPALVGAQDRSAAQQLFQQGWALQMGEGGVEPDLEKALRFYLQALRVQPSFYEAHANAAKIYYTRKDYRLAKGHFSEAIKLARGRDDVSEIDEAAITSDLGGCLFQEGQHAEAEKWFRGAIGLDPGLVEARYNLINLLLADDRRDEALREMKAAATAAPSSRYSVFEGRLRSEESYKAWNPLWLKVGIGVVVVGLVLLAIGKRLRGSGTQRRRS